MPAAAKAGYDASYLKETVGDALARGCAATISAQPSDPVEYLGLWLLKNVKFAEVEGQFYKERQQELRQKKEKLVKESAADAEQQALSSSKKQALEALAALSTAPRDLLQAAVQLIKQYTAAGAAYAAVVTDPEEPDWTPPEDDEEAAAESGDEGEPAPAGEGSEEAPLAEEADEPGLPEGDEDGAPPAPKPPRPVNYGKKYFAYVAASAGQEHVLEHDMYRPAPPPEDADEAKPEPVPFTFQILDEKLPMIYQPNVAADERIKFFRKFPKIGAYQACGIQLQPSGEFKAVVAADTLFPEGGAQPLSAEDRDFIWEVSQSLSKALNMVAGAAATTLQETTAAEALEALRAQVAELRSQATAEASGGEATPADGEGEEEAAPEAEPTPPEEEAEGEGEEDGEEGEDGEPKPRRKKVVDPIPGIKAAIEKLEGGQEKAQQAEARAAAALALEKQALAAVAQAAADSSEATLYTLRHFLTVPQSTFHAIKALLHLLGRDPASFSTWKRAYAHFTPSLLAEMSAYDATQERDMALWARVRSCYKAMTSQKKLEQEMPNTMFGAIVLLFIKQVRRVARKAVLHRAATAKLEKAAADLAAKQAALADAERAKAEAEAEAERLAAEAEAAAARAAAEAGANAAAEGEANAAAGEGEGGEGGEGEEKEGSSSSSSSDDEEE